VNAAVLFYGRLKLPQTSVELFADCEKSVNKNLKKFAQISGKQSSRGYGKTINRSKWKIFQRIILP
jgi:hypothetical protein